MQRKVWIDNLRGFCMLAILLDHTEIYYTGENVIDYNLYVANVLIVFFILSGYLMYKTTFNIKHKLYSIFRTLFIPYIVFTTAMYIPKNIIHSNGIDFVEMTKNILMGQASWFIAALIIAELIFLIGIWISKGKNMPLAIMGVLGFGLSIYLSFKNQTYFWQLDNALQALLFLYIGYLYHQYESIINTINKMPYTLLLFLLLIGIKIYEYNIQMDMLIWHIHITNYPIFLIDSMIFSLMAIQLFQNLPPIKWLSWIGKHSIVYYFLCGGIPLITSKLLHYIGLNYDGNYLYILLAFSCVCIITTLITYFIYKYTPLIAGKYEQNY